MLHRFEEQRKIRSDTMETNKRKKREKGRKKDRKEEKKKRKPLRKESYKIREESIKNKKGRKWQEKS